MKVTFSMFHKFYIVIAVLLIINTAKSQGNKQYKKDSLKIWECPVDTIDLSDKTTTDVDHQNATSFPFSSFVFKDVRFEKRYIGVINRRKSFTTNGFRKLKFEPGTEQVFTAFFNDKTKYAFKTNSNELLCFIKQLRLTQIDSVYKSGKTGKLYTTANIEIESYLNLNDRFYPAVRLDTIASSVSEKEGDFAVLPNILNAFANKAALIDTMQILKRKAYSLNEIKDRYDKRLKKPIISDVVLNKGVYKTREEFLNNNPSVKDYEFSKENFLYTKTENNDWALTREAFGFCDSSRIWINVHNVFRPLIKQDETFEFLAEMNLMHETRLNDSLKINNNVYHDNYLRDRYRTSDISIGQYAGLTALALALTILVDEINNYSQKFVYQLNLETGEYY